MSIIDGRKLARLMDARTRRQVATLRNRGVIPTLVEILVGSDPASRMYLRLKHRKAGRLGIRSVVKRFPKNLSQDRLLAVVHRCNSDSRVNGIVIQSPVPSQIDENLVNAAISPAKDADGVNPLNEGRLFEGASGFYPIGCTPKGIMIALRYYQVPLAGRRAVVIGRSRIVGRPMTSLLINAGALVTDLNHFAKPLGSYTKGADLIISAAGQANLVRARDVKPGAAVVDVGENRAPSGRLVGDVDFTAVSRITGLITPVPGGVGPVTVATLMSQVVELTERSFCK